jgi:hypothetical protein
MLLLFGIPVYVWMKWRASMTVEPVVLEPVEAPPAREPVPTTRRAPRRKPARVR